VAIARINEDTRVAPKMDDDLLFCGVLIDERCANDRSSAWRRQRCERATARCIAWLRAVHPLRLHV